MTLAARGSLLCDSAETPCGLGFEDHRRQLAGCAILDGRDRLRATGRIYTAVFRSKPTLGPDGGDGYLWPMDLWLRRMMSIILRLIAAKRHSCQGTNVRRNTVNLVGLVTYRVFSLSIWLLRDPAPAGPQPRLVEKQVVQQDLDPVAGEADLAEGAAHVTAVVGVALVVGDDRIHDHRGGGARERIGARRGHAGGAHLGHRSGVVGRVGAADHVDDAACDRLADRRRRHPRPRR